MGAEKRWRLVCYDVRDPVRYRKVFKIVRGAGEAVQYSVFRCRLDDLETERLRWRLSKVMDPEDSLLVVDLCPSCARKVVTRNHVEGWEAEPSTFQIVEPRRTSTGAAPKPRHGSSDAAAEAGVESEERPKTTKHSDADPRS